MKDIKIVLVSKNDYSRCSDKCPAKCAERCIIFNTNLNEFTTDPARCQECLSLLTWKDVFNSYKFYPNNFQACTAKARSIGYRYIAFNGLVYSVTELTPENSICTEDDLDRNIILRDSEE